MVERGTEENKSVDSVIETLALVLIGRIKFEDLGEDGRFAFGFYIGLMDDDPLFREAVETKKNQLLEKVDNSNETNTRVGLFSEKDLEKARNHKKSRKKHIEIAFQPLLFKEEGTSSICGGGCCDPEKNLALLHKEFERKTYFRNKNSIVEKEIKFNKQKLREEIGLPIVRGRDPRVKDKFYGFLVKNIVKFDSFGIFAEYDGMTHDEPNDLDRRIKQVRNFVGDVLSENLGTGKKYFRFHEFKNKYDDEWGRSHTPSGNK